MKNNYGRLIPRVTGDLCAQNSKGKKTQGFKKLRGERKNALAKRKKNKIGINGSEKGSGKRVHRRHSNEQEGRGPSKPLGEKSRAT